MHDTIWWFYEWNLSIKNIQFHPNSRESMTYSKFITQKSFTNAGCAWLCKPAFLSSSSDVSWVYKTKTSSQNSWMICPLPLVRPIATFKWCTSNCIVHVVFSSVPTRCAWMFLCSYPNDHLSRRDIYWAPPVLITSPRLEHHLGHSKGIF